MPAIPPSYFSGGRNVVNQRLSRLLSGVTTLAEQNAFRLGPIRPEVVNVYTKDDFPDPVGDEISLDPTKYYFIHQSVNLGTDVLVGSTLRLLGTGSDLSELITASAKPLIKTDGTGDAVLINGVDVKNFGGGAVLDLDQNPPLGAVLLYTMNLTSTGPSIIINDSVLLTMDTCFLVSVGGMEIRGTVSQTTMQNVSFFSITGAPSYVGFTVKDSATVDILNIHTSLFSMFNASDYALMLDPAATYQRQVRVTGTGVNPPDQALDPAGLDQGSPYFIASGNSGLEDSIFAAQASFTGNTADTTFPAPGTKVRVGNGTPGHPLMALGAESQRFSLNSATEMQNQQLVCDFVEPHPCRISANLTMTKGAGTVNVEVCIYVNNTEMVQSCVATELTGTGSASVLSENIVTLTTSDVIDIRISNETDTDPIDIVSLSLIAQRL